MSDVALVCETAHRLYRKGFLLCHLWPPMSLPEPGGGSKVSPRSNQFTMKADLKETCAGRRIRSSDWAFSDTFVGTAKLALRLESLPEIFCKHRRSQQRTNCCPNARLKAPEDAWLRAQKRCFYRLQPPLQRLLLLRQRHVSSRDQTRSGGPENRQHNGCFHSVGPHRQGTFLCSLVHVILSLPTEKSCSDIGLERSLCWTQHYQR